MHMEYLFKVSESWATKQISKISKHWNHCGIKLAINNKNILKCLKIKQTTWFKKEEQIKTQEVRNKEIIKGRN